MPKKRKHLQTHNHFEKITGEKRSRAAKTVLILIFIGLLAALALVLLFGGLLEAAGMPILRKALIAILIMLLVSLTFTAPMLIEFNRNPRPLSGPGKNPKLDWGQWK
jgi:hypothetical protein